MKSLTKRISVNSRTGTPIYLQLAGQLRHLIRSGELRPQTRLPSARHLASNLHINRNTVQKAYALLSEEDLVDTDRGRGTTVKQQIGKTSQSNGTCQAALNELLDEVVTLARAMDISPEDLGSIVMSHARASTNRAPIAAAFVECNPQSLELYEEQLSDSFDIQISPVLLMKLEGSSGTAQDELRSADCVITTFFHFTQVRSAMKDAGIDNELFAIGVRPHIRVLQQLEGLHRDARVGVLYVEDDFGNVDERLTRMTTAIQQANLRGLEVESILWTDNSSEEIFEGFDAIVVRPNNVDPLRARIPEGVEIVEFVNELDDASRQYLDALLEHLRSE